MTKRSKLRPPNRALTSEGGASAAAAPEHGASAAAAAPEHVAFAAAAAPVDDHTAAVDRWIARCVAPTSTARVVEAFVAAFAVVWRRAHQTLGDITLTAIAERVLHHSADRYPLLVGVHVDATGLRADELRTQVAAVPRAQLAAAARFVIIELLTVVGDLTGEILTAALHEELSKVPP